MKYFITFIAITVVMSMIADIAFRYEMKKYKEKLERRNSKWHYATKIVFIVSMMIVLLIVQEKNKESTKENTIKSTKKK